MDKNNELHNENGDEKGIPSPFIVDIMGNVHEPEQASLGANGFAKAPEKIPSAEQLAELTRRLGEKHVSDETFNRILAETKSKSAIILTFEQPMAERVFKMTDFHISVANILYENVRPVLHIILDALNGRLGGNINIKKREE